MVLVNIFARQPRRHREDTLVGTMGEGEGGTNERAGLEHRHRHVKNREPVGYSPRGREEPDTTE